MNLNMRFILSVRYLLFALVSLFLALLYIDEFIAQFFHDHAGNNLVWISAYGRQFFAHITVLAEPQYAVIPALMWWLYGRYNSNETIKFQGRFAFMCLSVTGLIVPLLKFIFRRARPSLFFTDATTGFFLYKPFWLFSAKYASFPSGHSVSSFVFLAVVSILSPKHRLWAGIIATLCAVSRIVLGAHYLSDVIAGTLFGYWFAYFYYNRYFRRDHEHIQSSAVRV